MSLSEFFTNKDNRFLIISAVLLVVFFIFVYPKMEDAKQEEEEQIEEQFSSLAKLYKYDTNMCSRDCCHSAAQWPVPHDTNADPRINPEDIGKTIFRSNLACSGYHDGSGCVCLNKENIDTLRTRGDNARCVA